MRRLIKFNCNFDGIAMWTIRTPIIQINWRMEWWYVNVDGKINNNSWRDNSFIYSVRNNDIFKRMAVFFFDVSLFFFSRDNKHLWNLEHAVHREISLNLLHMLLPQIWQLYVEGSTTRKRMTTKKNFFRNMERVISEWTFPYPTKMWNVTAKRLQWGAIMIHRPKTVL